MEEWEIELEEILERSSEEELRNYTKLGVVSALRAKLDAMEGELILSIISDEVQH